MFQQSARSAATPSTTPARRTRLPYATVFTHLGPAEDPLSFDDTTLDGAEAAPGQPD